jgi:glutamine synthetase
LGSGNRILHTRQCARFDQSYNYGFYYIDSEEGFWNAGQADRPNLGYKPRYKEGYFPVPPMDHLQNLRSEMMRTLEKCGVRVEVHHHEVGTAGQAEIDMRFTTLTRMADQVLIYKYIIKNVARRHGKTVTVMPKPIFQDNGSGMHTHQSLWKAGKNVFYDAKNYALISNAARHYIGGVLQHAHALCAFVAPTTNSYRRLVPGYEAPINIVYSQRNRSVAFRSTSALNVSLSSAPRSRRLGIFPTKASTMSRLRKLCARCPVGIGQQTDAYTSHPNGAGVSAAPGAGAL